MSGVGCSSLVIWVRKTVSCDPIFICATAGPKSRPSELPPSDRLFSIPMFQFHVCPGRTDFDRRSTRLDTTIGPLRTHSRHNLWTLTHARQSPHISIGLVGGVVPVVVPSASHRLIKIVELPPMCYLTSTRGPPFFVRPVNASLLISNYLVCQLSSSPDRHRCLNP